MSIEDLTLEPPRSPKLRIRGYAILARTLDKCRATIAGKQGTYYYDCPVDRLLFDFKHITGLELKNRVEAGGTDTEIAAWLDKQGERLTSEQITDWSDQADAHMPYNDPDTCEWFALECHRLGIDPRVTTLFDYLEKDDVNSFLN